LGLKKGTVGWGDGIENWDTAQPRLVPSTVREEQKEGGRAGKLGKRGPTMAHRSEGLPSHHGGGGIPARIEEEIDTQWVIGGCSNL